MKPTHPCCIELLVIKCAQRVIIIRRKLNHSLLNGTHPEMSKSYFGVVDIQMFKIWNIGNKIPKQDTIMTKICHASSTFHRSKSDEVR